MHWPLDKLEDTVRAFARASPYWQNEDACKYLGADNSQTREARQLVRRYAIAGAQTYRRSPTSSPVTLRSLDNNVLEALPSSLRNLTSLETLMASGNQISYLDDGIGCCAALNRM